MCCWGVNPEFEHARQVLPAVPIEIPLTLSLLFKQHTAFHIKFLFLMLILEYRSLSQHYLSIYP